MSDNSASNMSFVMELAVLVWPLWFALLLYAFARLAGDQGLRYVEKHARRRRAISVVGRPQQLPVGLTCKRRPQYRLASSARFLVETKDPFVFDERKYRRGLADFAASEFLTDLETNFTLSAVREPLVRLRDDFRQLIHDQPVAGLIWCLSAQSPWRDSARLQRMVVCLLGRCGNSRGIVAVAHLSRSEDRRLRVAVARALARLRARGELQEMADSDPDPWIRQFAARHARRSFADQLEMFAPRSRLAERTGHERPRSKMPFVLNVQPLIRRPPKSAEVIRMILERIRDLLHGPRRVGNGH